MAGGGNFVHRVLSYVVNELVVNGLANNPAFQRFAVRTSKKIEDISVKGNGSKIVLLCYFVDHGNKPVSPNLSSSDTGVLATLPKIIKSFILFAEDAYGDKPECLRFGRTMASIITTKANHFRYAIRFLSSHLLRYATPITSSPSFHHPNLVGTRGYGNGSLMLCQRFLYSAAAGGANVNQEKPASDNSPKDDSGKGKEYEGEQDQKSDAGKSVRGGPVSWLSFLLLVVTGAGLVLYYDREKKRHIQGRILWSVAVGTKIVRSRPALISSSSRESAPSSSKTTISCIDIQVVRWLRCGVKSVRGWGSWFGDREIHNASEAVKQGPSAGKAAIGGPFRLINHDGKHVTEKDFLGKWTLLYFGFTHCPDICPDELQKLAAAVDKIIVDELVQLKYYMAFDDHERYKSRKEKAGIEIVPVFISVDPERDTVEQVGEYVKEFHPKLIGLTGSVDEVKNVARAYRVYYMKTAEEDSDYLVDHSIVIYLMDPDMGFVKFFGKNNDANSLADGVVKEIKQYKK
ncbi:hypothetical protein Lal_00038347 [Lupinus albus]|nr:hypothetical protein Lal_00038347 [Lupinus albus]